MPELGRRGVEEILVEKNLLTAAKLQELQIEAAKLGRPIGDLISERNVVSPEDYAQARSEVLGIPFVKLSAMDIPAEILNLIPQNTATRYVLIPFDKTDSNLKVAMNDPLDLQVIGFLERRSGLHIEPHIAPAKTILEVIEREYRKTLASVVSRIKILSNMKIDEKRIPQDGRFKVEVGGREIDLRIATMPTSLGEKVAIRLLEETAEIPTLDQLGMRGVALKRMEDSMRRPNGIVLVTGPTGSGKTLTLAGALSKVNSPRLNIVTVEAPVEVRIPGINQTQINPVAGLTFATGLRAFLRQDPNIIMVGEIRDS